MAESKHTRKGKRRFPSVMRIGNAVATFRPGFGQEELPDGVERPSEDEIRDALAAIPPDMNWEWARPRLVPLFEQGYAEGTTGDPMINTVSALGVGIGFGIDIGAGLARVTRSLAQRWEVSVEQLESAAFAHLAGVAASVTPRDLQPVVLRGHMVRALGEPQGWASSMVLAGEEELTRIFGPQDQVFTTPARNSLFAFDATTPPRAIAEITIQFEALDPHPLEMDPFVLAGGTLSWDGLRAELEDVP